MFCRKYFHKSCKFIKSNKKKHFNAIFWMLFFSHKVFSCARLKTSHNFNLLTCLACLYGFHHCSCSAEKQRLNNTRHSEEHSPRCNPSQQHSLLTLSFPQTRILEPQNLTFKNRTKVVNKREFAVIHILHPFYV